MCSSSALTRSMQRRAGTYAHTAQTGTRAVSPLRPGMCAGEAAQLVLRVRRWMATERSVRMVLQKLAVVRWDRLVEGERLARLRVDGKYPGTGAP